MDIKKIAKLAGVSTMTVSNVLNNKGRMSVATRKRVLDIIKMSEYYPNEAARILSIGKKDVIAFVSSKLASPFISEVLSSIEDRAIETNKYVFGIEHYSTRRFENNSERILNELLYSKKVSGVILLSILPQEKIVEKYKQRGVPLVLLESKIKGAHCVHVNNKKGSYDAVQYLIKKGRKRICIITARQLISEKEEMLPTTLERMEGYMSALRDNGITFEPSFVEEVNDYTFEDGVKALERFISKKINFDSIFCASGDITAMGVLYRAKELGIKIPDDVSLIGYDDFFAGKILTPALTTVKQPIKEMGQAAFDLALEGIQEKLKEDKIIELNPQLIIRESA
jgi:LacI family transcriptional regulator